MNAENPANSPIPVVEIIIASTDAETVDWQSPQVKYRSRPVILQTSGGEK
jgi:hypothetical protein